MYPKTEEQWILAAAFAVSAILLCVTALRGALSGHWEQFIVSTPFFLALVPGYWGLLPRGGMRHGHSCECTKPDAACELGFWFEHGQKLLLLLPLVLMSIFLGSILLLQRDLEEAVLDTSLAALTALVFSGVCAWCFYIMVKKFNRKT